MCETGNRQGTPDKQTEAIEQDLPKDANNRVPIYVGAAGLFIKVGSIMLY